MFFRPLAFAFLVVGGATAQDTAPVSTVRTDASSALGSTLSNVLSTVPSTVPGTQASSEEGFMTIQTSVPSSIATDGPLTNPLRTTETIPQLTFCDGVYTNTPCASATGQISIPQGETPEPTSVISTSAASEGSSTSHSSRTGTISRPVATSSSSGSVPQTPTSSSSPGAAASVLKHDGSLVWVAALSGLSATLGFAWTLL